MIKSLQRLQNKAARIVANKPYDYPATCMLKELSWPSIKDDILKKTSIMTFKSLMHYLGPLDLNDLLQNFSQIHCRELRNTETDLRVPRRTS